MTDLREHVVSWQRGWGVARALPAAVDVGGGLRVHCAQKSREIEYVAYDAGSVRELAGRVAEEEAVTWLTVPTTDPARALADLDAAGLTLLARAEWLMITDLRAHPVSTVAEPYHLRQRTEGGVLRATVEHPSCEEAARATMGLCGTDAVADKVRTAPEHRRQGLGAAVMGTVARTAVGRGAVRGLLIASDEGRLLYTRLGWHPVAEVLIAAKP
ncbi:GNAT family N-acetyltransferase [Actinoplanes sp. NPDC051494]|uniref:GNAT family N-acetyltransferase n=1 Tax=Actinoplanes sp. NPDC051494 TaxID=3363907 RepID=UPI00378BD000